MVGCVPAGWAPVAAQERPLQKASLITSPKPSAGTACAGVIGTSRTIVATANLPQRIGLMQYRASLPLRDHEVVLTFDDGPISPYTTRVLDILAANCVKATFFLVGRMARAYPHLVRRIYNEGHTIGTHSHRHPLTFDRMAKPAIEREVNAGIASVQAAAGDPRAVAPFFRVPGLARSRTVDSYLAARSLMEWSADHVADDWHRGITAHQIVQRAMRRIAARNHRGVLLLHDIHAHTARALPMLLAALKKQGYRIVHVVPAGARPKTLPPLPKTMVARARTYSGKARRRAPLADVGQHQRSLRRKHGRHRATSVRAHRMSALDGVYIAAVDLQTPLAW